MAEENSAPRHVSGFVSILGRPNAGKSTLLNALVGTKVAIVADKPQTTRTSIQAVLTLPDAQIVFLDTPGIHRSRSLLNKRMMDFVREALDERDLLLFVADATQPIGPRDTEAVSLLKKTETPCILALNKIDRVPKTALLPLLAEFPKLHDFAAYVPISATEGTGLDILRDEILKRLPEGPAYFPPDHVTDQPERFLAAELIREQVVRETRQEVPHAAAVMIDRWEETPRLTRIYATIFVEREGQKAIVIGARGSVLKLVGTVSRQEMERLFGRKIFLDLHVKVEPGWREQPMFLQALDWRTMTGKDDV
ncbi:MAG: GTPase Era [Bryobacteraceae bacterium]